MIRFSVAVWVTALLGLAGACAREPLPDICPNVDAGQLVISELRGAQTGDDSFGHYIEIYNAAGKTVDLQGLRVSLRAKSGDELSLLVRDAVELGNRGYAVIGPGLEDEKPTWLDYGIGWDISGGDPDTDTYPRDFVRFSEGYVEIEACGELIDQVYYAELPTLGTLACGNATSPPGADDNDVDDMGCWCVDDLDGNVPGVGLPGTPGGANRCP